MRRLLFILWFTLGIGMLVHAVGVRCSRPHVGSESDTALSNYFYMEGEKQYVLGHYDASFALISEAVRLNPSLSAAKLSLAKHYMLMNEVDTALHLMQQVVECDTVNYWYNITYARMLTYVKQYDSAVEVLQRIIRNHPYRTNVYKDMATAYEYRGLYDKAHACYDSLEVYMGNSTELTTLRVNLCDLQGDTAMAIKKAEELMIDNPHSEYNALFLSSVYKYYKQDTLRMQLIENMLKLRPDAPLLYIEKADCYLVRRDTAEYHRQYELLMNNENIEYDIKHQILVEYAETVKQMPDDTTLISLYGVMVDRYPYEKELRKEYVSIWEYYGRYDEACAEARRITLQSDSVADWERLLVLTYNNNKHEETIAVAQEALKRGSNKTFTHLCMGTSLHYMSRYDEAEEHVIKALELNGGKHLGERAILYQLRAEIYSAQGVLDRCYQYYDSALVCYPENAWILNNYAYVLAVNGGDLLRAEQMSARSLQLSPDNSTFMDTYAWIMFKQESYFIARVYMERAIAALKSDEEDIAIYYEHYGDILSMSGCEDDAVKQWEMARQLGSESTTLDKKIELKKYIEDETNSIDNDTLPTGTGNGL